MKLVLPVAQRPQPARAFLARLLAGGVAPDDREHDDRAHDDEAHHRVVEHREGVERLPLLLDVLLVARVRGAALLEPRAGLDAHDSGLPRGPGWTRPARADADVSSRSSLPSVSPDGDEATPRRTTSQRCRPISAKIAPGAASMCIE